MDTVVHVNQLLESLDRAQEGRIVYLKSLQKEINGWQRDEGKSLSFQGHAYLCCVFLDELQHLCTEVDQVEGQKMNFRKCMFTHNKLSLK